MNDTGPDAVPPPASNSLDDRIGDRLVPVPEPNLNSMPSVRASVRIESIVSWTELMKQAEHCGCTLEAAVEPDRAVERRLLVHEDVFQIVAERLKVFVGREVLVRARPPGDRVHDAANQLLDAALALGRANLPAEILRDDDVGGLLGPGLGNLDVALLEDDFAALVADHRRAKLPLDLVERIDAGLGEEARKRQPGRRGGAFGFGARGWSTPRPDRHVRAASAFHGLLSGACSLVGGASFIGVGSVLTPGASAESLEIGASRPEAGSAGHFVGDRFGQAVLSL